MTLLTDENPVEGTPLASPPESEDLLTRLKYVQAEFDNYRKRSAREAETLVRAAHEALFARILPVLDELEAATASSEGNAGDGIRMIRDNLMKALGDVGLVPIPALDLPFDPYVHECVDQVSDASSEDGVVKEVVRKGYRTRDQILRPAQVIVVNNGSESNG